MVIRGAERQTTMIQPASSKVEDKGPMSMIQAFYQALQPSVSWERVSKIQSTKEMSNVEKLNTCAAA